MQSKLHISRCHVSALLAPTAGFPQNTAVITTTCCRNSHQSAQPSLFSHPQPKTKSRGAKQSRELLFHNQTPPRHHSICCGEVSAAEPQAPSVAIQQGRCQKTPEHGWWP